MCVCINCYVLSFFNRGEPVWDESAVREASVKATQR